MPPIGTDCWWNKYSLSVCAFNYEISCIIRPRRSRSAAAYSRQTAPWTICRSVGPSVCRSVQWIVKKRRLDPDAVWHRRSDASRDEAGGGDDGKGYFWGRIWGAPSYSMGTLRRTCATVPQRGPLPKLLWADLLLTVTTFHINSFLHFKQITINGRHTQIPSYERTKWKRFVFLSVFVDLCSVPASALIVNPVKAVKQCWSLLIVNFLSNTSFNQTFC